MVDRLRKVVSKVVANENCSGCGACVLISSRVKMELSDGFMRPSVSGPPSTSDQSEARTFRRICPGVCLRASEPRGRPVHPTFGPYVRAFAGFATDAAFRQRGSSGGVLSALAAHLIETGSVEYVTGVTSATEAPIRTVPVKIMSRDDALAAAGSRYAPVATLAVAEPDNVRSAVIGKPCEISALARFQGRDPIEGPIRLSFFCAGTPSQNATESLVDLLDVDRDSLISLKYRGDGWPGSFVAKDASGTVGALSYDESWGAHLGKAVQWRCKLCPDGTGGDADVAVGDFWEADANGFPTFVDADGNSVVIARTTRGLLLLESAVRAGVIRLEEVDLDAVANIQPLQVKRKRQLLGRLTGRFIAGKRVPVLSGYGLLKLAAPYWRENLAALSGAFRRSAPRWLRTMLRRR